MTVQSFAYEKKGNSAVIWRCFSHDSKAEVPSEIAGLTVKAIAPYTFSAHMDEQALERGISTGKIQVYRPEVLQISQAAGTAASIGGLVPQSTRTDMGNTGKTGAGMEGLPPALCGERLEEVIFPDGIEHVGRYCFYNCGKLDTLEFNSGLSDWGSGVFTGCHKIRKLRIHVPLDTPSYMKPVLDELREELLVEYYPEKRKEEQQSGAVSDRMPGGTVGLEELEAAQKSSMECAHLVFPEFFEEGIENTPARILEERVHGTGVHFRNCFKGREFDFRQYDSLFSYAIVQESKECVAEMAMGRLLYPYCLSDAARDQYQEYVRTHAVDVAELLLLHRDTDGIRWLLNLAGENTALHDYITERASKLQYSEALSYLMEFRRMSARPVRRRREL